MEITPDNPSDPPVEATAARTTNPRQRVLAALVMAAAALLVYSLSGGDWARMTVGAGADRSEVELRLSGDVDVEPAGGEVADALEASTAPGSALQESVGGATRDLTQILAVLIAVVAAVGLVLDLRSRLWGLLASASLVCLLAAAVLRDAATTALATAAAGLDAGPFEVRPTGWSGLAIGAAACAALAAFLATAERGVAARAAAPIFDADGDPDQQARPARSARPRRSTPAGRVRARWNNSLPSRSR
ncbi:MAG TPA: hypothetical protein VGO78_27150 [Acidimicrobiales bacterium]|nr:hypothetical protein [Acidimicrobiales bacterium]